MLLWTLGCMYWCVFELVLLFLSGYIPRSGITESYVSYISSFLRKRHTVLHRGYTNWYKVSLFPPTVYKVSFSPYPLQHLLFVDFLMIVIQTGVRYISLFCISVIIGNVEHHFMCLLAIFFLMKNVYSGLLSIFCFDCLGFFNIELCELLILN